MPGLKERTLDSLTKRESLYLARAVDLAKLSTCNQRHGAIIMRGSKVIGQGTNIARNDPDGGSPPDFLSVHAEISALRSIPGYRRNRVDLSGCKIFVARVSRRGFPALSRPCDLCYLEILGSGIREVIYTS